MSRSTSTFTRVAAGALYPIVLVGSCGFAGWALLSGGSPLAAIALTIGAAVCLLTLWEYFLPYSDAWKPTRRTVWLDVAHSLVSAAVAGPVVRVSSVALAAWLGGQLSVWLGSTVWPSSWPLFLQLGLAVVVADLGAYSAHRFMHATRVGWRLHALHHTPTRLYAVAAGRAHPFNAVLTMTCESVPVILLGITPEAFALLATFKAINGLLQHSNIALTPGPLSYVIATSDVHRFHHSVDLAESNSNFGNTTMVWDHLFGTFYLPHRQPNTALGIADADIPEAYVPQLLSPFLLRRYESAGAGD